LSWEFIEYGDFVCPDEIEPNDLQQLSGDWLLIYTTELYGADANGDKVVNFLDFAIVAEKWLN